MTPVVGSLEWRGERLTLCAASLEDVPGIVAFHRLGVDDLGEDASPADWFSTGGPWMHAYFCSRHVRVYRDLGWDCWVVERGDGTIAGSVEICYATEPPPFGRYAHLELLELADDLLCAEVEEWILDLCEARSRARGFERFWCRPVGSGGSPDVLVRRGYVERWRNGWLTLRDPGRAEALPHDERPLRGDYDGEGVAPAGAQPPRVGVVPLALPMAAGADAGAVGLPDGRFALGPAGCAARPPSRQRPGERLAVARSRDRLGRSLGRAWPGDGCRVRRRSGCGRLPAGFVDGR